VTYLSNPFLRLLSWRLDELAKTTDAFKPEVELTERIWKFSMVSDEESL